MATILIVDDETNLRETVGYNLRREGHQVVMAADGPAAVAAVERQTPDLIILDVMLPGLDGFEVCRRVRQQSSVPILMLTAKDSEIDRVVGLELGADDYVVKPFSMRELVARVRAMLRRAQLTVSTSTSTGPGSRLEVDELSVDLLRRRVTCRGQVVQLKPKEFDLLAYLAAHPGRVFTRDVLLENVWGYDYTGDTRTVDVHVRSLREKLGDSAETPRWIETVWGVGYRFRDTSS